MNLIYTALVALPLGYFVKDRTTGIFAYLLAGSYLFSFQSTNLILGWLGHSEPSAFGAFPDDFPARASTSSVFDYGAVNVLITIAGIGLVVLGGRLRSRRVARRDVVNVR